ncbi:MULTISPECIES: TIGR02281 family clan AA aspartic protease [unclassified Mesorhizobium]|uniref:TIGR02281 family clan AA aspartic protease n=1 Tax=unclassified Mesorhizobium TaxID=325217 RepID=UPI000BB02770|nr:MULTISPECIES: TIGR02281 family clan AA aspartic protease [unclassified Mesorhizobium]TGT59896.1 TIGR02281 family clan AA aspartic protease [Mesorhizobium sp. M00.F.Ca.ET.170.01.1.1]AZO08052.1 TIGR02281 family clan AA aspartic protease [Mesorhizobium sp. M3A.F.Ca.ET.080.04.2.1]PBB87284.1 TIGR02281 family clan AA aspartic protease [Mesorhizobium sp. WSM3876]RWB70328.1 MAG: TIGR02281 family clan AA aspartic protease [Mesorhizobium sp.]RWE26922.1 MAG: TIGR02281 family clan AA aspartic protease 
MNRLFWIVMAVIGIAVVLLMLNDSSGRTLGFANDDFGRLIWLGALGTLIGASFLRSGRPLGDMARSLGVWAAIVLALIAGYQYRYELQDVASRVTAGLVPGSPLALGVDNGRATVALEKADNGHFEARVLINGTPVRAVVDTGATTTVLTAEDAQAVGFNPAALDFTTLVSTANGMARAATVKTDELAIGGIVRKGMPVMIAAPGMLERSLLGMNFIGSLSGFDVRGDRMILRD